MATAVAEFQLLLVQLAADLGIKIGRLIGQLDRLDQREALAFITDAYPELARAYLAASGELTVQWYNEQPTPSKFVAESVALVPDDRLAASGRWALLEPDPVQALVGSAQRAVMDQSRATVLENIAAEYNVPMTEVAQPGTRWARHASANACSFCRVMATKGAVYRSEQSAKRVVGRSIDLTTADKRRLSQGQGFLTSDQYNQAAVDEALDRRSRYVSQREAGKAGMSVGDTKIRSLRGAQQYGARYHDHCHCTAVPVRPGDRYEPPAYVEQWRQDYSDAVGAARKANRTKGEYGAINFTAVLTEMDRAART